MTCEVELLFRLSAVGVPVNHTGRLVIENRASNEAAGHPRTSLFLRRERNEESHSHY